MATISGGIIPIEIRTRVILELYNAGLNAAQISQRLGISFTEVKNELKGKLRTKVKTRKENKVLIDRILYDTQAPLAVDVLIENEKARYSEYSNIEKKCLEVMNQILDFYISRGASGNIDADYKVAQIASGFIKATQEVRQELLKKYEIDKESDNVEKGIKIEFI